MRKREAAEIRLSVVCVCVCFSREIAPVSSRLHSSPLKSMESIFSHYFIMLFTCAPLLWECNELSPTLYNGDISVRFQDHIFCAVPRNYLNSRMTESCFVFFPFFSAYYSFPSPLTDSCKHIVFPVCWTFHYPQRTGSIAMTKTMT